MDDFLLVEAEAGGSVLRCAGGKAQLNRALAMPIPTVATNLIGQPKASIHLPPAGAFRLPDLKIELQTGLKHATPAASRTGGAGDQPSAAGVELVLRHEEIRVVQSIERFETELNVLPLLEAEVLHESEIEVSQTRRVEDASARVAIHEGLEPVLIHRTADGDRDTRRRLHEIPDDEPGIVDAAP